MSKRRASYQLGWRTGREDFDAKQVGDALGSWLALLPRYRAEAPDLRSYTRGYTRGAFMDTGSARYEIDRSERWLTRRRAARDERMDVRDSRNMRYRVKVYQDGFVTHQNYFPTEQAARHHFDTIKIQGATKYLAVKIRGAKRPAFEDVEVVTMKGPGPWTRLVTGRGKPHQRSFDRHRDSRAKERTNR